MATVDGQPRQILHLVSTLEPKTDTLWLWRLARHINRERFRWSVACYYAGGPLLEAFEELGIPSYNLDVPREADPRALVRTCDLIGRLRPDVVHTHLLRADLYGGLAARLEKVPVVLTTAYAVGAFRRERVRRLDGLIDQVGRHLPTHVLTVAEAVRRDCIRRLRWPADRVTTIHTGVEIPATAGDPTARRRCRTACAVPLESPIVFTAARLSYEKGLPTLIDAAIQVVRRKPDVRFVIAGEGPLRNALTVRIRAAGLDDHVRLLGFRRDVEEWLQASDVFVLPSRMEGMPNALLEAMAAGLPVVASAVGGIPEAVRDGIEGVLVPPSDPTSLADAVMGLLEDSARRAEMAAAARRRIEVDFHVGTAARRYECLYDRLIRERAARCRRSPRHETACCGWSGT